MSSSLAGSGAENPAHGDAFAEQHFMNERISAMEKRATEIQVITFVVNQLNGSMALARLVLAFEIKSEAWRELVHTRNRCAVEAALALA